MNISINKIKYFAYIYIYIYITLLADFAPTQISSFLFTISLLVAAYYIYSIASLRRLFNLKTIQFEDLKMLLGSKQRHSEHSEESLRRQKLQTSDFRLQTFNFKLLKKTGSVGNNAVAVPSTSTAAYHSYCANYSNLILPVSNCGKLSALFFFLQQIFNSLIWKFENESIGKYFFAEKKLRTSNFRLPTPKNSVILSAAKNLYADQEIGTWANSQMGTLKSAQRKPIGKFAHSQMGTLKSAQRKKLLTNNH